MRGKILLLGILFSFKVILTMDVYIPRNENEKKYLEKIRSEKLVLGTETDYFADEKIEGESLNDIIMELLNEYLQLNVKIEIKNWNTIYKDFQDEKIQLLNFLTKTKEREKIAVFSNKILDENLVVISKNEKIYNSEELNKVKVYVTKNTIYEKFLEEYKEKNELYGMEIIKVNDVNIEDPDYYVGTSFDTLKEWYNLNLVRLPETTIGIRKEYEELKNIINNALTEKYSSRIDNWIKKRRELLFKNKFLESLTNEENEYLDNLKPLKIVYANVENISSYSVRDEKFIGVLPGLLDYLFEKLEVNIVQKENFQDRDWPSIYESFLNKDIDILTLSRTPEREKDFIFTRKIYDLNVFFIESLKGSSNRRKIGVIKNSIEESIAKAHYLDSDIKVYLNRKNMMKDLKNHKLTAILSLNSDGYNKEEYDIKIFETAPVNLALAKDQIILRDILNKAIVDMVDLKDALKVSNLEKRRENFQEQEKNKEKIMLIILGSVTILLLAIYQSFKVFLHKKKNKELLKDELTGLYSRRLFNEFCKNNINISGYALLMDLNNFKILNDTYGHDYGDKVLIEAGKLLKDVFKNDSVFRISGDEFYIFSDCLSDIKLKIKKIEILFKYSDIMTRYKISFSLGYYLKKEKDSMDYAFKQADSAMYLAKKSKKNWSQEATYDFIKRNRRKKFIEKVIEKSIDTEFYPVFQKKYELKNRKIIGAEAFARWYNNFLGQIDPDEFIPVAENLGLIHKIDYKIAAEAIRKTKEILEQNIVDEDFRMSFNISLKTLKREDVVEYIFHLLEVNSLNGKNIEIEIKESTFSEDIEDIVKKLNRLRKKDIYISIDDFTAGYSSLGLLTTLPINTVKFNKSLITSIGEESEKERKIYLGLTNMIKSLKLKVIAEGIEKKEQFEFLKKIGVLYGQGYYFGNPERELRDDT